MNPNATYLAGCLPAILDIRSLSASASRKTNRQALETIQKSVSFLLLATGSLNLSPWRPQDLTHWLKNQPSKRRGRKHSFLFRRFLPIPGQRTIRFNMASKARGKCEESYPALLCRQGNGSPTSLERSVGKRPGRGRLASWKEKQLETGLHKRALSFFYWLLPKNDRITGFSVTGHNIVLKLILLVLLSLLGSASSRRQSRVLLDQLGCCCRSFLIRHWRPIQLVTEINSNA